MGLLADLESSQLKSSLLALRSIWSKTLCDFRQSLRNSWGRPKSKAMSSEAKKPDAQAPEVPKSEEAPAPAADHGSAQAVHAAAPAPHGAPASHASAAPKAPSKVALFFAPLKAVFPWIKEVLAALFAELKVSIVDPRYQVRRMVILFFVAVMGAFATSGKIIAFFSHREISPDEIAAKKFQEQEIEDRAKRIAASKTIMVNMGTFLAGTSGISRVESGKGKPGGPTDRVMASVMNVVEMEVVVECNEAETCEFVEKNLDQARHQITMILTHLYRDDLMTREGKRALKQQMLDSINKWMPEGTIKNIHFVRFVTT